MSKKLQQKETKTQPDDRVRLYPDGKYRWVYEVPMLRNPSILIDVYKVLGISFGIVWLFVITLIGCDGDLDLKTFGSFTSGFLLLILFFFVLGYVAYFILAWSYGWKYVVLFILDEKEVVHQQMPRQVKKSQVLNDLVILAGALSGRPGVAGAGFLAQSRTSSTSVLANVKKVIPCRRMNLIKVNQLLNKNRVFVCDEDYDFVFNFLCKHCTNAKIK
ncbi:MAG: hypothetical protein K5893_09870 [Prevotella sp.]|nr:hypothetical protein [Prevotella sp.]